MLRSQEGLKFTPLKLAEGYLRLERMGRSVAEIASGVGRSRTHVESYLILARANTDVHHLVRSGEVNAQAAIDAFRVHGEQAGAFLAGKLAEVKSRGKKVLSQDAVKDWAPPRKHAGALYGSMSAVVQSLDQATRRQLAEIENLPADARAGHKISVDAATFLEMFHTHVAATDFRDAKQKKGDQFRAAASQQQLDIAQTPMGAAPPSAIPRAPAKPPITVVDLNANYKGLPEDDPLLGEARQLVIEDQRASISYMQRKLRIGYNRAAALLEELERQKVLSQCDESGTRSVLLKG
ncbi:hypothetical protein KW835_13400 [Acidovorax sp. sic0104]|nr:hypothetical protein [Acidovorax sp. sic0104]